MNSKIVAEDQVGASNCNGCCFDTGLSSPWLSCKNRIQTIGDLEFNCTAGSGLVYKRRENMNDISELKAGMIVVLDSSELRIALPNTWYSCGLGLYLNNGEGSIDPEKASIKEIYTNIDYTYFKFFSKNELSENFELVWSKQSPKEMKILELESTVKEALKQIEELKGE